MLFSIFIQNVQRKSFVLMMVT